MTTRLVRDEPSCEKSTRLLEMSGGERLRKNRVFVKKLEAVRPAENERQCCPVVRALSLRSGDPGFKTRSLSLVEFVPGIPWFNFPAALVNSQLVCLRPVGILNSCCCVLSFR